VGWDWFSVQLDNQTELMLFQLRRKDGAVDPHSSGTYIDAGGNPRHLQLQDFRLQPLETWTSPDTKGKYPVRWRIQVPSLGIDLYCSAARNDQEIPSEGAGPGYWEGAVSYTGSHTGAGYLEMTGYDGPVKLD
jgi:predicted secreted hydrolase